MGDGPTSASSHASAACLGESDVDLDPRFAVTGSDVASAKWKLSASKRTCRCSRRQIFKASSTAVVAGVVLTDQDRELTKVKVESLDAAEVLDAKRRDPHGVLPTSSPPVTAAAIRARRRSLSNPIVRTDSALRTFSFSHSVSRNPITAFCSASGGIATGR